MRRSTSASQARGSTPLSFALVIRVYIAADRSPSRSEPAPPEPTMPQERTVQALYFEVFAQHEIGCELQAMSRWLDSQPELISVVAGDLRRQGVRETGRRALPAESVLRCVLLK